MCDRRGRCICHMISMICVTGAKLERPGVPPVLVYFERATHRHTKATTAHVTSVPRSVYGCLLGSRHIFDSLMSCIRYAAVSIPAALAFGLDLCCGGAARILKDGLPLALSGVKRCVDDAVLHGGHGIFTCICYCPPWFRHLHNPQAQAPLLLRTEIWDICSLRSCGHPMIWPLCHVEMCKDPVVTLPLH